MKVRVPNSVLTTMAVVSFTGSKAFAGLPGLHHSSQKSARVCSRMRWAANLGVGMQARHRLFSEAGLAHQVSTCLSLQETKLELGTPIVDRKGHSRESGIPWA